MVILYYLSLRSNGINACRHNSLSPSYSKILLRVSSSGGLFSTSVFSFSMGEGYVAILYHVTNLPFHC